MLAANSPSTARSATAGTEAAAGRCRARLIARVTSRFVSGSDAVQQTGPASSPAPTAKRSAATNGRRAVTSDGDLVTGIEHMAPDETGRTTAHGSAPAAGRNTAAMRGTKIRFLVRGTPDGMILASGHYHRMLSKPFDRPA
jgi:hypothetical protein